MHGVSRKKYGGAQMKGGELGGDEGGGWEGETE